MSGSQRHLLVKVLREANVGDAGGVVAQEVHVRVHDHRVDGLAVFAHHCNIGGKLGAVMDMLGHTGHS